MFNDWITIGGITIHGYGVMIALGILAAFFSSEYQAKKYGYEVKHVDNIIFISAVSGFVFAKVVYILVNLKQFFADPSIVLSASGWVVYGGIIGALICNYIYAKVERISFKEYFDLLAPMISLAQGFGRIGCFFAGCCYGVVTTSRFAVTFPVKSLAPSGVPLVPTQLLSSFGNFVIFAILFTIYRNEKTRKYTGASYLILYSIGRFMVEFLRGDLERGFVGSLSTSQLISIFVAIGGILYFISIYRKEK